MREMLELIAGRGVFDISGSSAGIQEIMIANGMGLGVDIP